MIDEVLSWVGGADLVARACPSAQKARERSSMQVTTRALGCMATARVSGDDLDPAASNTTMHTHPHVI